MSSHIRRSSDCHQFAVNLRSLCTNKHVWTVITDDLACSVEAIVALSYCDDNLQHGHVCDLANEKASYVHCCEGEICQA